MPQFAANLSMLYPELPFLDRFAAAAQDGFTAVEYLFPYDWPAAELAARLQAHGLQQVLFNAPPGGGADPARIAQAWNDNLRGMACLPEHRADFRAAFDLALRYAEALNCPRIHVMAGLVPEALRITDLTRPQRLRTGSRAYHDQPALRETYLANLEWAAAQAAVHGVDVLIEPINTRDIPGFFINHQADAHAAVQAVGATNLKVQFDLYHCQIVEGDVISRLREYLPTGRVGHVQIAGIPDRHEPHEGELAYSAVFNEIDALSAHGGWSGWLGCEYRPRGGHQPGATRAGLQAWAPWLKR